MERIVYIDTYQEAMRRVIVEDGVPVEMVLDAGNADAVGNIFVGRVDNVLENIGSAFVNIGMGKNAFLPLSEAVLQAAETGGEENQWERLPGVQEQKSQESPAFAKGRIAQGQEIIVQVTKSASGDKGARLTMHTTFPGKYCVLLPTAQKFGVSRHIRDASRRETLEAVAKSVCPEGMGTLIRTAADDTPEERIRQEAQTLYTEWKQIAAHAKAQKAPAMIFDAGNLIQSTARDVDAEILRQPLPLPLEEKLKKSLRRKIWLPSGAYLVVDHTEAMTVIDVNSGKYSAKAAPPDTIRKLNREAAAEAARQIRLRDIGGIIVIDFIDMRDETDRDAVLEAFEDVMRLDRAKLHIHGFSAIGLLELTRRSVCQPLQWNRCPHCMGTGYREEWESQMRAVDNQPTQYSPPNH